MCLGALHHHKWLPWEARSSFRDGLCQGFRLGCYARRNYYSTTVQQQTFHPLDMGVSYVTSAKFRTVLVEMGVVQFPEKITFGEILKKVSCKLKMVHIH